MVDVERIGSRLDRLERLIELLEEVRAAGGHIDKDLGETLVAAAGQRNVLVHMYLDIDDREVFSALDRLDDLRSFAAAAQALADRN